MALIQLRYMVVNNDLLDYLNPSSITRLLYAIHMTRSEADISYKTCKGKRLMRIDREILSDSEELYSYQKKRHEIVFAGKDLYMLRKYIWSPMVKLRRIINIWLIIADPFFQIINDGTKTVTKWCGHPYRFKATDMDIYRNIGPDNAAYTRNCVLGCLNVDWHSRSCDFISKNEKCSCDGLGSFNNTAPIAEYAYKSTESTKINLLFLDEELDIDDTSLEIEFLANYSGICTKNKKIPYIKFKEGEWKILNSYTYDSDFDKVNNPRRGICCHIVDDNYRRKLNSRDRFSYVTLASIDF